MMQADDYINAVVGADWKKGATGCGGFDCWGLVVDSYKQIDGVNLPPLNAYSNGNVDLISGMKEALIKGRWKPMNEPQEGCVVACFDKHDNLSHVGRYYYGKLFHASGNLDGKGQVCLWPIKVVERKFARLEFYQWQS